MFRSQGKRTNTSITLAGRAADPLWPYSCRREPVISPVAVQPRNNHLTGVHLMGMHITGVHLMAVYLTGVHLMAVHLIGVYLMGVHLIDVYFMDVYMFPNPKRLWGKPPEPYKWWSIC
jgi:hypothetical protein